MTSSVCVFAGPFASHLSLTSRYCTVGYSQVLCRKAGPQMNYFQAARFHFPVVLH